MNAKPHESYNNTLFSKAAYPNWRTYKLKGKKTAEEEEDQALRESTVGPNKSDYTLVKIDSIPDWFCPILCAGLDLSDLIPKSPKFNKIELAAEAKKFRFKSLLRNRMNNKLRNKSRVHAAKKGGKGKSNNLTINDFEENDALNIDRDNGD